MKVLGVSTLACILAVFPGVSIILGSHKEVVVVERKNLNRIVRGLRWTLAGAALGVALSSTLGNALGFENQLLAEALGGTAGGVAVAVGKVMHVI